MPDPHEAISAQHDCERIAEDFTRTLVAQTPRSVTEIVAAAELLRLYLNLRGPFITVSLTEETESACKP